MATHADQSLFISLVIIVVGACAQTAPAPPAVPAPTPAASRYETLIAQSSKTERGLFSVYRVADKLYFEIPRSELGQEILLARHHVRGRAGVFNDPGRVVVLHHAGNRLLIRHKQYAVRGVTAQPRDSAKNVDLILAALEIDAFGPDSSVVVDVTRLVTSELFSPGMLTVDAERTFIESFAAFPDNVNVELTVTGTLMSTPPAFTGRLNWSFYKLPEPMRPRLFDSRIGLDGVCFVDFSQPEHESRRGYIRRFRLEKKNPQAAISDPIKPIIFWVDRGMPKEVMPWVQRAVEAWQPAFRDAGFSNAIIAKVAPTPEEDPKWSPGDIRHSVIRWGPDTTAVGGSGGIVAIDPRSGEIIRSDVGVFPNMKLFSRWYFVQAAPLDPRARSLPLPDSLLGSLVEYVVKHEVGHALGLTHNMKASAQYPVDSLRSASFLRRMGLTPSIMDYARFNYVAQPEDNIPAELLVPHIGPYDRFAIMWAYQEIPGARTPEDEIPTINRWAALQQATPFLRYTVDDAAADVEETMEAVGDADPVRASTLGMENLRRVMAMMLPAAEQRGRDYALLRELYDQALEQWLHYNWHVAALIGGVIAEQRLGDGPRFAAVPATRQKEALRYLAENAFQVPRMFLDVAILRRIEEVGIVERMRGMHGSLLNSLLSGKRLNRMLEYDALAASSANTYRVIDFLTDLRSSIWREVGDAKPVIDIYRRNLQHAYLEAARTTMAQVSESPPSGPILNITREPICGEHRATVIKSGDGPARYAGDPRALLRGELLEVQRSARAALGRTQDVLTQRHLRDVDAEIKRILAGPAAEPPAQSSPVF